MTRKITGSYYTDLKLTDIMISELVEHLKVANSTKNYMNTVFWDRVSVLEILCFHTLKLLELPGLTRKRLRNLSHMIAAANEVDEDTLRELHAMCVNEVSHINGTIEFEKAVEFQRE